MTTAIEFDFSNTSMEKVALSEFSNRHRERKALWLDLDGRNAAGAIEDVRRALPEEDWLLPIVSLQPHDVVFELNRHHLRLAGWACWTSVEGLSEGWFDIIVAEELVVTIDRSRAPFMEHFRNTVSNDFENYAKSQSFLLYAILDAVIESYRDVVLHFERRVAAIQKALLHLAREDTFSEVSRLQLELVNVRRHLTPLREALLRLSRHKSVHVSEATQPYMQAFAESIDRIVGDLSEHRNLLLDTLNLYMSIVGNRTNTIMNRLTVISFIFLPLSFICGIYGMNFRMPEYGWPEGYTYFWVIAITWVVCGFLMMRRLKIL